MFVELGFHIRLKNSSLNSHLFLNKMCSFMFLRFWGIKWNYDALLPPLSPICCSERYSVRRRCTGTRNCLVQLLKFTKDSVVFTWCSKDRISVKRSYLWSSSVIYYAVYTLYLLVLALSTLAHTFSYRSISCSLFIPLLVCTVLYQQLYVYKLHKLPRWALALGANVKKLYC